MNMLELEKRYGSEEKCRGLFEQLLWPKGPICPHCESTDSWSIASRRIRQCARCHRQFSLTTKTIFHGTKLGFRVWLRALFFVINSSKGVSSVYLGKWIGVSQKSSWKIIHAIRAAMETHQIQLQPLKGVVELDEKYVGGKPRNTPASKSKRGRGTDKEAVFVAVERRGRSQAFHIESLGEIDLIAKCHIEARSHIMSDEGRWYQRLSKHFRTHETVNHSLKEYARGHVHNNTAESFAAILERAKFGVYHYISPAHLHHYAAEVVFRWNHRVHKQKVIAKGKNAGKSKTYSMALPFLRQLASISSALRLTQIRRSVNSGIKLFPISPLHVFGL